MDGILSPDDFAVEMRSIIDRFDADDETMLGEVVELMADTLRDLGYGAGIDLLDAVMDEGVH